jgi:predicted DCC family thiol-disulfide oxidoreductase YuxK
MEIRQMAQQTQNIIYFDGHCGLCNGFVDFVLSIDNQKIFQFAPLQGEFARQHLPAELVAELKTVIVQVGGKNFQQAQAVIQVFKLIGPPWSLLGWVRLLPADWLNALYDLVASHRYRWFGKKDTCRIPTAREKERFIL